MNINADRDRCIGAGQCVANAPEVFDQDRDGVVEVVITDPGPEFADEVRDAVRACPVQAVLIE
jgi:ferredoxin